MTFDFARLIRMVHKSFFASRGTHARLTPKRILVILLQYPLYIVMETVHWLCFLLDEILFRAYRRIEVRDPVFIVGVPRSGTTFMHRLIAKDEEQFTSMRMWEILLAPSITEKKLFLALGALDRRLGGPLRRLVLAFERRGFREIHRMHKLGLFEPEEDDAILLHIFSSAFLSFMFPFEEEIKPLARFDLDLSPKRRQRVMRFYKRCVQRHLYVFGRGRRFLSKNPAFSPKVRSLWETFPSARIVCMVRTPLETVPSSISLLSTLYGVFLSPLEPYPLREQALEMVSDWYRYPIEQMEHEATHRQAVVLYGALVNDPERAVLALYERFGFQASAAYRRVLTDEKDKARRYRSDHEYSLEQFGLTREEIVNRFRDVFDRFGFATGPEVA